MANLSDLKPMGVQLFANLRERERERESFYKAFGRGSITSIHHLDETAAFVQFTRADLVSDFLKLKDNLERHNKNPISVLHPLSRILETGCIRAATYEMYKEVCCSPLSEVLFADQAERIGMKGASSVDVDGEDDCGREGETTSPAFRAYCEPKQSSASVRTSAAGTRSSRQTVGWEMDFDMY